MLFCVCGAFFFCFVVMCAPVCEIVKELRFGMTGFLIQMTEAKTNSSASYVGTMNTFGSCLYAFLRRTKHTHVNRTHAACYFNHGLGIFWPI